MNFLQICYKMLLSLQWYIKILNYLYGSQLLNNHHLAKYFSEQVCIIQNKKEIELHS